MEESNNKLKDAHDLMSETLFLHSRRSFVTWMTGQCFQEKEHVLKHGEAIDQKFVDLKQMPMKHRHFIISYLLPLFSCFVIKSHFL